MLAHTMLSSPLCGNAQKENRERIMKLIKPFVTGLAAMVVAAGFALSAQAIPITGQLNITGSGTYDHPIGTATKITMIDDVLTGKGNTGSFAGIPAMAPVTMQMSYVFNPSTSYDPLWSVGLFTFSLTSSHIEFQSSAGLLISGTGTIFGPVGFDPTPGTWSFSQQAGIGTTLTFSATTFSNQVPDGGMTVTLLGAGLVGLAAFRAKFAKAKV